MIFNLFKSKPILKELIPNGFVDIHSHVLPGIDDGPKKIEEAKILISRMNNLGFAKIIATPHTYAGLYENSSKTIKKSFESLNLKKSDKLNIKYASEYLIDYNMAKNAEKKELLTIKDNYVLGEFSFLSPPEKLHEIVYKVQVNGYRLILAHPERYIYFNDKFDQFYRLKKLGVKFQLNILSLTNYYGKTVNNISEKLIYRDLIDYIGSDIHNLHHIEAIEKKKIKSKYADKIVKIMEKNILDFS